MEERNFNVGECSSLLRRALLFVESSDWGKADDYCERVLDMQPENAQAYVIKLMIRTQVKKEEDLANVEKSYADWNSYINACRFADEGLRKRLEKYLQQVENTILQKEEDAKQKELMRLQEEEEDRKARLYRSACYCSSRHESVRDLEEAVAFFSRIQDYKDSYEKLQNCKRQLDELKQKQAEKLEEIRKKKRKKTIILRCVWAVLLGVLVAIGVVIKNSVDESNMERAKKVQEKLSTMTFVTEYRSMQSSSYGVSAEFGTPSSFTDYVVTYQFLKSGEVIITKVSQYAKNPYEVLNGKIQYDDVSTNTVKKHGYTVDVSFFGSVTVKIGDETFTVNCSADDVPISIKNDTHTYSRK